jgi:PST family polysaccharide transporter
MRRSDIVNLCALAAIQVSNALVPLVVFPYALSVLGAGQYSKLVITEALMLAVMSVVLFSFEVDGVARVARLDWRREGRELSNAFSTVLCSRLLLFVVCFVIAGMARPFMDRVSSDLLFAWLLVPLSYALQANWLFQAIEQNVFVSVITVVSRICATLLIFYFVVSPADAIWIPLILGACYLSAALCALGYSRGVLGIRVRWASLPEIIESLRYGRHIFIGNIAVMLYRDSNVLILAISYGEPTAIAAYSLSEKVVKGVQATMRPLNQVYFQKAVRTIGSDRKADRDTLRTMAAFVYPQCVALTVVITLVAVFFLVCGDTLEEMGHLAEVREISTLFAVMVLSVYFGIANFMLGTVGLNQLGARRCLYRSILTVGVLSVASCATLSMGMGGVGAAISFVFAEILLFSAIVFCYLHQSWVKRSPIA